MLASWGPLGGPLGALLGPLGGLWGHHGAILGGLVRSWAVLAASGRLLRLPRKALGAQGAPWSLQGLKFGAGGGVWKSGPPGLDNFTNACVYAHTQT